MRLSGSKAPSGQVISEKNRNVLKKTPHTLHICQSVAAVFAEPRVHDDELAEQTGGAGNMKAVGMERCGEIPLHSATPYIPIRIRGWDVHILTSAISTDLGR